MSGGRRSPCSGELFSVGYDDQDTDGGIFIVRAYERGLIHKGSLLEPEVWFNFFNYDDTHIKDLSSLFKCREENDEETSVE